MIFRCLDYLLCIHSPSDGRLGGSCGLATGNPAAAKVHRQAFVCRYVFNPFWWALRVLGWCGRWKDAGETTGPGKVEEPRGPARGAEWPGAPRLVLVLLSHAQVCVQEAQGFLCLIDGLPETKYRVCWLLTVSRGPAQRRGIGEPVLSLRPGRGGLGHSCVNLGPVGRAQAGRALGLGKSRRK